MRDADDDGASSRFVREDLPDAPSALSIEACRRLIQKHDLGLTHDALSEKDSLALTSRKLVKRASRMLGHVDTVEGGEHHRLAACAA